MTRIQHTVGNLVGGVSQLPGPTRLEGQVESQENHYSSPQDGLMKRPPLEHIGVLVNNGSTDHDSFMHIIDSHQSPVYVVRFDDTGTTRIWDASDGTEMTVSVAAAVTASGYLTWDPAARNLKAVSLADTTFVINKAVTAALADDLNDVVDVNPQGTAEFRSASARRVFYWIRSTNFLRNYKVIFTVTTEAGVVEPPLNSTGEARNAEANVKTHDGTFGSTRFGSPAHTPPYTPLSFFFEGFQIDTVQAAEVCKRLYTETPQLGSPQGGSDYRGGIRSNWDRTTASPVGTLDLILGNEELLFAPPQLGSVAMLQLTANDKLDANFRAAINLDVKFDDGGEDGDIVAWGDTISRFEDLPDICAPGHTVKVSADLSDPGKPAHYVRFVGETPTYAFVSSQGLPDLRHGKWEESLASAIKFKLNPSTMPVQIVRVLDAGEPKGFRFDIQEVVWGNRLVGDDDTNPAPTFVGRGIIDLFFYRDRMALLTADTIVLSEVNNFFNYWRTTTLQLLDSDPIDLAPGADTFTHGVAFEDVAILFTLQSQFVLDGDPVLTPGTVRIAQVTEFATASGAKPVVTETGVLFPYYSSDFKNVQLRELRRIGDSRRFDAEALAVQVPRYIRGNPVYLTVSSSANVLCMTTDHPDETGTIWVYKWLDLGGDRIQSAWQKFTTGSADTATAPQGAMTRIVGMGFLEDKLYVGIWRASDADDFGQLCLEEMTISTQRKDLYPVGVNEQGESNESAYLTLIDRRITDVECEITYDTQTQDLKLRLPYVLTGVGQLGRMTPVVVSRINAADRVGAYPEGLVFTVRSIEAETISSIVYSVLRIHDPGQIFYTALATGGSPVARDLRLWVGEEYTALTQLTRPVLIERRNERPSREQRLGRLLLQHATIAFDATAHFEVDVAPEIDNDGDPIVPRDTFTSAYNPLVASVGYSELGEAGLRSSRHQVPIRSDPEWIRLLIRNASPFPSNLRSVDYESTYQRRAISFRA